MTDKKEIKVPFPDVRVPVVMTTQDKEWALVQFHIPSMITMDYSDPGAPPTERYVIRMNEPLPMPHPEHDRFVFEWKLSARQGGPSAWFQVPGVLVGPGSEPESRPTLTEKVGMKRPK